MSEKEELERKIGELADCFHSLPLYKRYLALKNAIQEDKRLQDLLRNEEDIKKSLRFLRNEEKKEAIRKAKAYLEEYESNELVINYQAVKEELIRLLEPLNSIL